MKCKVCGKHMNLNKKNKYEIVKDRYEILEPTKGFVSQIIYEAFDCPRCGCQNIVNVREDMKAKVM